MPLKSWGALLDEAGDQATTYTVLPAADYDVEIEKAEAKMSGAKNLYFAVTVKVITGPNAGRKMWTNITVAHENPVALGIFFRTMAALGIDKDYFAADPSDAQVAAQLLGRKARVQAGIKQYQGADRNEVKAWFPIKETSATPPPPPPIVAPPAVNAAPTTAAPTTAPAPVETQPAAAVAPPVEPPAAPATPPVPPPAQPTVPPVPDTPPVAEVPPLPPTPPTPPPAAPAVPDTLPPPPEVGKPF